MHRIDVFCFGWVLLLLAQFVGANDASVSEPHYVVGGIEEAIARLSNVSMEVEHITDVAKPNGLASVRYYRSGDRVDSHLRSIEPDGFGRMVCLEHLRVVITDRYYRFFAKGDEKFSELDVSKADDPTRADIIQYSVGPLGGYVTGASGNLPELLRGGMNLSVRSVTEPVDGVECNVVECKTKFGKLGVWTAPSLDFLVLKVVLTKGRDDLLWDRPLFDPGVSGRKWVAWTGTWEHVQVKRLGGVPVPISGTQTVAVTTIDGKSTTSQQTWSCTNVDLHPDFAKAGAFVVDWPNGARVINLDYQQIAYKWQDGKVVPVVDLGVEDNINHTVNTLTGPGGNTVQPASPTSQMGSGAPSGAMGPDGAGSQPSTLANGTNVLVDFALGVAALGVLLAGYVLMRKRGDHA